MNGPHLCQRTCRLQGFVGGSGRCQATRGEATNHKPVREGAVVVHDTFGHSGGAARVQHVTIAIFTRAKGQWRGFSQRCFVIQSTLKEPHI